MQQRQRRAEPHTELRKRLRNAKEDGVSATRHLEPDLAVDYLHTLVREQTKWIHNTKRYTVTIAVVLLLLYGISQFVLRSKGGSFGVYFPIWMLFFGDPRQRNPVWTKGVNGLLHYLPQQPLCQRLPILLDLTVWSCMDKRLLDKTTQDALFGQLTTALSHADEELLRGLSDEHCALLRRIVLGKIPYPAREELQVAALLALGSARPADEATIALARNLTPRVSAIAKESLARTELRS